MKSSRFLAGAVGLLALSLAAPAEAAFVTSPAASELQTVQYYSSKERRKARKRAAKAAWKEDKEYAKAERKAAKAEAKAAKKAAKRGYY